MNVSFHLGGQLKEALLAAARQAGLPEGEFAPEVRAADPIHGDFQANGVLAYARLTRQDPRAVAEKIAGQLGDLAAGFDFAVAGPGFINFKLKPAALLAWLQKHDSEERLRAAAAAGGACAGRRWVVDYSSPNTAKQMHVGHLRSAVIGEAISRLLAFGGATVIRDNHLGDWGTQFGKLIYGYRRWASPAALEADPIGELERLYKLGHAATPDGSPELDEARQELVKLQSGDPENVALWRKFTEISLRAFDEIYTRLGIRFDCHLGESFYHDRVGQVYRELTALGLAQESEGALVVFHPGHPRFRTQPFLIRKTDGASNYASTDLATALYRAEHFKADGIAIVTDFRQADHFEQLFLTIRPWFEKTGRRVPELHHVVFGAVTGEDGKALKTRDGGTISLKALLDEAEERAFQIVSGKNPGLPEAERRAIAQVVGIGAVQYADLSQNRSSNYVFSWDKMLSLEGNTAPYLLYAVARLHSIFRKSGLDAGDPALTAGATPFATDAELALARKLVGFAGALDLTLSSLRPHYLCTCLYELAGQFSNFYTADKVLVDDPALRARRLLLCARTLLILESGLHLLGLRTLTRM